VLGLRVVMKRRVISVVMGFCERMLDEEGENGVGKTFLMFGVWRMVN
jgi:hypothetical protein